MALFRGSSHSNLQSFIDRTTPVVPSQSLPKSCFRDLNRLWHPWDSETVEYFTLQDLWGCYDEWSAYGTGTPVVLNGDETLVQYHVPYLSAIQIYTSFRSFSNFRRLREDTETGDPEMRELSDTWSDESESDKLWRSDGDSFEDSGSFDQDGPWHFNDRLGYLSFEYFERFAPYGRAPLMDKVSGLAQEFPGLMTLKNIDLSPASWMAVAWYPIYHIPIGRSAKDLSACFLTYHTLSSSFQEVGPAGEMEYCSTERKGITLPPFGLATYKMQGSLWVSGDEGRDHDRLLSLWSAADSWLKQLGVQHHDFNYFTGIRRG